MGLFDDLKKAAEGATGATAGEAGGALGGLAGGGLQTAVTGVLGAGGAKLPGLLDKFGAGGLGDVAQSWVGKGANLPISAQQIKTVLGSDVVQSVATKLGISPAAAAEKLADILPKIIDKLTPDGIVPDPQALADKLAGMLKS